MRKDSDDAKVIEALSDLLCALLAVNQWDVDRTMPLAEALAREDLLLLPKVAEMSTEDVAAALERSGYSRGPYMCKLLAQRWCEIAKMLSNGGALRLLTLEGNNSGELDRFLLSLPGVGPDVLRKYKFIRNAAR